MKIETIRTRLTGYRPAIVEDAGFARAAVAVVLREGDAGAEFIAIHRSHRTNDPWSGHMALPGGRREPSDPDLFATASRETHEEVGVDLRRHGELLGHLDELRAVGRGRRLDLIITPFVWALTAPVELIPNKHEVQKALWVPLTSLAQREARGSHRTTRDGRDWEHPAYVYQGHTIWGLTYRILTGLLDMLAEPR